MTAAEHQIRIERETNAAVIGALIGRYAETAAELDTVKAELEKLKPATTELNPTPPT